MGHIVISCYKPKPGQAAALRALMREHLPILRGERLATERESIMMVAQDGTIVEVFEWVSAEALANAHTNPVVQEMWARYANVCDYVPIAAVPEAQTLFSGFVSISER